MIFPMIRQHEFYGYSHSEHTETKVPCVAKVHESRCQNHRQQQNVMAAGIRISYIRILLFVFGYILLVSIRFNSKSSKFRKFLLASYGIFRNLSYLCPRIEAFFAYCKIQKRAEVRSFPYCYLYYIGKRPTS